MFKKFKEWVQKKFTQVKKAITKARGGNHNNGGHRITPKQGEPPKGKKSRDRDRDNDSPAPGAATPASGKIGSVNKTPHRSEAERRADEFDEQQPSIVYVGEGRPSEAQALPEFNQDRHQQRLWEVDMQAAGLGNPLIQTIAIAVRNTPRQFYTNMRNANSIEEGLHFLFADYGMDEEWDTEAVEMVGQLGGFTLTRDGRAYNLQAGERAKINFVTGLSLQSGLESSYGPIDVYVDHETGNLYYEVDLESVDQYTEEQLTQFALEAGILGYQGTVLMGNHGWNTSDEDKAVLGPAFTGLLANANIDNAIYMNFSWDSQGLYGFQERDAVELGSTKARFINSIFGESAQGGETDITMISHSQGTLIDFIAIDELVAQDIPIDSVIMIQSAAPQYITQPPPSDRNKNTPRARPIYIADEYSGIINTELVNKVIWVYDPDDQVLVFAFPAATNPGLRGADAGSMSRPNSQSGDVAIGRTDASGIGSRRDEIGFVSMESNFPGLGHGPFNPDENPILANIILESLK